MTTKNTITVYMSEEAKGATIFHLKNNILPLINQIIDDLTLSAEWEEPAELSELQIQTLYFLLPIAQKLYTDYIKHPNQDDGMIKEDYNYFLESLQWAIDEIHYVFTSEHISQDEMLDEMKNADLPKATIKTV